LDTLSTSIPLLASSDTMYVATGQVQEYNAPISTTFVFALCSVVLSVIKRQLSYTVLYRFVNPKTERAAFRNPEPEPYQVTAPMDANLICFCFFSPRD
jgi:Tfp pilus assembly protein PilW